MRHHLGCREWWRGSTTLPTISRSRLCRDLDTIHSRLWNGSVRSGKRRWHRPTVSAQPPSQGIDPTAIPARGLTSGSIDRLRFRLSYQSSRYRSGGDGIRFSSQACRDCRQWMSEGVGYGCERFVIWDDFHLPLICWGSPTIPSGRCIGKAVHREECCIL